MPDKAIQEKQRNVAPTLGVSLGGLELLVSSSHVFTNGEALVSVVIRDDEYPEPAITHISLQDLRTLVETITQLQRNFCQDHDPLEM